MIHPPHRAVSRKTRIRSPNHHGAMTWRLEHTAPAKPLTSDQVALSPFGQAVIGNFLCESSNELIESDATLGII